MLIEKRCEIIVVSKVTWSDIAIFVFHHAAFQPTIVLIIAGDSVFVSK